MSSTLGLLDAIDRLYADVVTAPDAWGEQSLADWANEVTAGGVDRQQARSVRRALRIAQRLRDFWLRDEAVVSADDWRTRVDVALGPRAWRPTLELAQHGLDVEPSAAVFDEVKARFRIVNSEAWMDGVDFAAWYEESRGQGA